MHVRKDDYLGNPTDTQLDTTSRQIQKDYKAKSVKIIIKPQKFPSTENKINPSRTQITDYC